MNSFLPIVEELPDGHPVKVYYEESVMIQCILLELSNVEPETDFQTYYNFNHALSNYY